MKSRSLKFAPGPGGWLHVDWGAGSAWVRFGRDEQSKLTRITELHVLDPTPERLRQIPLSTIQTAATARGAGLLQLMLIQGLNDEPAPEMLSTPPRKRSELVRKNKPRYKLKRPAARRLDDSFYENVARAYTDALARGLHPRQTIAADAGAAPETVAGWVLEARKRGHLPPTSPGKAAG